jgi:hypothetical protein
MKIDKNYAGLFSESSDISGFSVGGRLEEQLEAKLRTRFRGRLGEKIDVRLGDRLWGRLLERLGDQINGVRSIYAPII